MKIDQLYELFDRAIELKSTEELTAFLQRECADHLQRQELIELLQAHQQGHRLLDNPTQAMEVTVSATGESEGDTIGNYKLLQKIGEGGMGIVFMAEQLQPIRRKVALKVIREGINSKQILARFEAEREALARLDHPNATRILDAGVTLQGRPFFVMDLVRGTHITQYCNAHRLTIVQRLELMEKVCMVIHHAHQKGILHRDIKPSNVMITLHDGVPVPKVIDFGIAKALDRPLTEQTLFTRYGDLVGTPEYMSPEQAEMSGLDLDVRTDIYSLGVVLYELLTGSTPITSEQIKGRGLLKIFETIRDSEAELPSLRVTRTISANETVADQRLSTLKLLRRDLVGDLDWITMKALSKDRNERYDSAAAMSKDIRNFLQGEPVEAAAPSLVYRARKFYRKHRAVSIVASASAALLIASTALSIYWAFVSADNAKLASEKSEQLEEKSEALEDALDRALKAEKKSESFARDESRRATEANARSALLADLFNRQDQMLRSRLSNIPTSDSTVESATDSTANSTGSSDPVSPPIANVNLESENLILDESNVPTMAGGYLATQGVHTIVGQISASRIDIHSEVNQEVSSTDFEGPGRELSRVFIQMQNSLTNPISYWDFLLEEQRKTFGNQDVFVAETLYNRAVARVDPPKQPSAIKILVSPTVQVHAGQTAGPIEQKLEAEKPNYVAAENDLREAISILADKTEVDIQRLETLALLSQVLQAQDKQTQAAEFDKAARELLQHIKAQQPSSQDSLRIDKAAARLK